MYITKFQNVLKLSSVKKIETGKENNIFNFQIFKCLEEKLTHALKKKKEIKKQSIVLNYPVTKYHRKDVNTKDLVTLGTSRTRFYEGQDFGVVRYQGHVFQNGEIS